MHRLVSYLLLSILLFAYAPPCLMAASDGPAQVNSAIKYFGSILKNYENIVIQPVARHQAVDSLKLLSATLKSVRDDKQKADEDALGGRWDDLERRLPQLEKRVSDMRTQTESFADKLPDQYRTEGFSISEALFNGLSYKINLMGHAQEEIRQGHSKNVQAEMACAAKVISVLSSCVEAVIGKLSGSSTDVNACRSVPAADADASVCAETDLLNQAH